MTRNMAASVHQRLLNHAHATGRPFNEILQYFALERFLYRLGQSSHAQNFVLKGALMLTAWQGPSVRSTRDVDLLGHLSNSVDRVVKAIKAICIEPVPVDDGLIFDTESIAGERIVEGADYQGVRVHIWSYLGTARIRVQVDVGFGDPVVPPPTLVQIPTILDFPPPLVRGYSRESAIAEKFHAMVFHGEINSRMKDFFDIWVLATQFHFDGQTLIDAIRATFQYRQSEIQVTPVALTDTFASRNDKQTQWAAFARRLSPDGQPPALGEVVQLIASFLQPATMALSEQRFFDHHWPPGGPWQEKPTQ